MAKKITLLDGAVGTTLWGIAEAHGVEKVPVWRYNIEHPEFVEELTRKYLEAGSEIILANTFGANGPSVKRSSPYEPSAVVKAGVEITKKVLAGTGVKTCMSAGPLTEILEPYGDLEEDECREIYEEMINAGVEAGCDMIMVQTFMDLAMMKIAAEVAKSTGLPVFCSMTFEKVGKTMFGNSVQDVIDALAPLGVDAIGLNCSLGPDLALPIIKEFAEKTDLPIIFKPNAGKPILSSDGTTAAAYTAEQFAIDIKPALEYVSYVGGCCGSDSTYVKELKKLLA
ncbi:MAG: homocysteine S-methyltransferase family protein [Clostridia bacterium]|nr:homocysteine S-methyltransferase family protein [Clostridia bacterium]